MDITLHQDKTFENIDYSGKKLARREFVSCVFVNCDFTKSDLSGNDFEDCIFQLCNLSLTVLQGTGLRNIRFDSCKLMGIDFSVTNKFSFSLAFQDNILDYSSFFQCNLKKTAFLSCSLKQVDFAEADLSKALFKDCDLASASFMRTNLEQADFRTARNYSIDPELNKMKRARFSSSELTGLLHKYNLQIE